MEAMDGSMVEQVTVETVNEEAETGSVETFDCKMVDADLQFGVNTEESGGAEVSGEERGHSVHTVWGSEEESSLCNEESTDAADAIMGSSCGSLEAKLVEQCFPSDLSTESSTSSCEPWFYTDMWDEVRHFKFGMWRWRFIGPGECWVHCWHDKFMQQEDKKQLEEIQNSLEEGEQELLCIGAQKQGQNGRSKNCEGKEKTEAFEASWSVVGIEGQDFYQQ